MAAVVAGALWSVGGAFATSASIWIASNAFLINSVAFIAASSGYSRSKAKRLAARARADYNASLRDRVINTAVVDGVRSRVYGRLRVADGVLFKGSHGENSKFFTQVIALAGHEIDGVEQVYFNEQPLTLDGAGWVQNAPWNAAASGVGGTPRRAFIHLVDGEGSVDLGVVPMAGSVHIGDAEGLQQLASPSISIEGSVVSVTGGGVEFSGTFVLHYSSYDGGGTGASKARVRAFLGAPGQDLSGELAPMFPGLITSAHRFAGIACLVVTREYDQDAYPTGLEEVSAVVRGAKVLDPRTGLTAWTENPALIARDWALYAHGGAAELGDLKLASFTAAANACDVPASFTTVNAAGSSSTATLPTYTCGIAIPTDTAPDEALDDIVAAMAGDWAWAGGQLVLRAGSYQAPSLTLDETWVSDAAAIDIVPQRARTELVNVITPTIANKAQAYVAAPIPRIEAPEYIAADGGEYPLDIELLGVTDVAHAAHVAGVMLRSGRQALTVQLPCNLKALQVELFDTVLVSLERFGWVAKAFECVGWRFAQTDAVMLTLRETDASIYTVGAAFSRSDAAPNTALPSPFGVPALTSLVATSGNAELLQQADGTLLSRVRVAWAAVADEAVREGGAIEIQWGPWGSTADTWQTVRAEGSATQAYLLGVKDGSVIVLRARARNKLVAGPWSALVVHEVQGKTAPPSDVLDFEAEPVPGGIALRWTACPDLDYAETELRIVPPELSAGVWTWADAIPLWSGAGTGFTWLLSGTAEHLFVARHRDASGNRSATLATTTGTAGEGGGSGGGGGLSLSATAQVFTFTGAGAAVPAAQTITFLVSGGTPTWEAKRYSDAGTLIDDVTSLLGGSGSTRTLGLAAFGTAARCVVSVTAAGVTRSITVVRLRDGADSPITTRVLIYKRSTGAAPALPTGPITFTFSSGVIAGATDGWSVTVPAGAGAVYVSAALASAPYAGGSTFATIPAGAWAGAVLMTGEGLNQATVTIYRRSTTAFSPMIPGGTFTFTFATGLLSGASLEGWSQTVPPDSGGKYLFIATATAIGSGPTDSITAPEWATVRTLSQNGPRSPVQVAWAVGSQFSIWNWGGTSAGDASAAAAVSSATGGDTPIAYDIVTLYVAGTPYSETRYRSTGGSWVTLESYLAGDALVADAISQTAAGFLTGPTGWSTIS